MCTNGIYILKLKDQFRVAYIPNAENLNWCFLSFDIENYIIDTRLVEFYENAKSISEYKNAMWKALKIKKRCGAEIHMINHNKTWNQTLLHAKYLAVKELETIEKNNDSRWDSEAKTLLHIQNL